MEVPFAIELLEYYRKRAEKFLADSHPRPHSLLTASKKLTIAYRPPPVVGVICPWNNPVLLALADALPALLAGAAVAIKPSELGPHATIALRDCSSDSSRRGTLRRPVALVDKRQRSDARLRDPKHQSHF